MILIRAERDEGERIHTHYEIKGETDTVMAEIAAGTAGALLALCDDLAAEDGLHESMTRVVCSMIRSRVEHELTRRAEAADKQEEA